MTTLHVGIDKSQWFQCSDFNISNVVEQDFLRIRLCKEKRRCDGGDDSTITTIETEIEGLGPLGYKLR